MKLLQVKTFVQTGENIHVHVASCELPIAKVGWALLHVYVLSAQTCKNFHGRWDYCKIRSREISGFTVHL